MKRENHIHAHCAIIAVYRDGEPMPAMDNHCGLIILIPEGDMEALDSALHTAEQWQKEKNRDDAEREKSWRRGD